MADIVKIFYDVGKSYADRGVENFNEIDRKNISKIAVSNFKEIKGDEFIRFEFDGISVFEKDAIKDRLFLRVTSSNGGNLYPLFFYDAKKLESSLKKAFKNMAKYLDDEKKEYIEALSKSIDTQRLAESIKDYEEKNLYLAVFIDSKSLYEIFPEVSKKYVNSVCNGDIVKRDLNSYFCDDRCEVGFDAGLNFCSLHGMPKTLSKNLKYKTLSLSKDEACLVKQGFEIVFDGNSFIFNLFGNSYYLLPTLFFDDYSKKREFFDKLIKFSDENSSAKKTEKHMLQLLQRLDEKESQKLLLSFLFYEKSNNAINLYTMIEDVAPSRVFGAFELMDSMGIEKGASRFIKKNQKDENALYIRDYIEDNILLAEIIFGKVKLYGGFIHWIYKRIFFGDNRKNATRKKLAYEILFYSKYEDFQKHQRFLDFLIALEAIDIRWSNYIYKEVDMDSDRFSDVAKSKFNEVQLLQNKRAREFYILGALAILVIKWQKSKNKENNKNREDNNDRRESTSLEKYLDSIGSVTMQNSGRVFNKIYNISRKYSMYGDDYDDLITLYSDIKEELTTNDRVSIDEANIAFVMGSVDFKKYRQTKKEDSNE